MALWVRYRHEGQVGFGTLADGRIAVHGGDMFAGPTATGQTLDLAAVTLLIPCDAGKFIGIWRNYHRHAATFTGQPKPTRPLYFFKPRSSYLATGGTILRPPGYPGLMLHEGELGVVIGRTCRDVSEAEAASCIFGYTCVNDVTGRQVVREDALFEQWGRGKGADTFGAFGPAIATGLDPMSLRVRTLVDGVVRQDYTVDDIIFPPAALVSILSRDMTLEPGDIIAVGTSLGTDGMPKGSTVEIVIDGIGTLVNRCEDFASARSP